MTTSCHAAHENDDGDQVRGKGLPMRVVVFGSTGRIGSIAARLAADAGHDVVGFVRTESPAAARAVPKMRTFVGSILDPKQVGEAIHGAEAVIAALGPRENSRDAADALETGMRHIVSAMEEHRVARLIALSGAGISIPGEEKPALDRLMSRLVRVAARHVVGAKQREFDVVATTGLVWTALRPPLVHDGPVAGYRFSLRLEPGARVTRGDVAAALVDHLTEEQFVRAAPFVLSAYR